ncbi:hypothetical protein TUM19329_08500 [Legionella antarctica]|uniref:Substrate of the Dot/Icm secretion system n=1 Tax=Legionella antarctica TaxID=2708020 RepID=A0A6F8T231_9GAMM|nr:type IV secretion protein Dot [Legionella antarctica]BCA94489.1 hypothetical protein TUM19329_08500 [Legionella antarctica]
MTFTPKDFEALKKHFNDTVTVLLKRDGKEPEKHTINDLTKRKEETLFLKAVLTELENRITENAPKSLKPYAEIFYGAQALIQQDIEDNRGWGESEGLLHGRLSDGMGITETNHPDLYQQVRHISKLNNFLKLVYPEGDSRNGLLIPNVLSSVPLDKLTALIAKGYQLEETARKKLTESYLADGKTEGHANSLTVTHDIPESAIAQFETFDTLTKALDNLRMDEIANKNVVKIDLLANKTRSAQFQSLLTMAETLSASRIKAPEKIGILAGMMLLVHEQIGQEYGKHPFSNDDIPGSIVHTGLTKILKTKEMSRENAEALITSAKHFMVHMSVEHNEYKGGVVKESVRAKHLFSQVAGFNLVPVLDLMEKLIKHCRIDSLNRCVTAHKKALEDSLPPKPSSAYGYLNIGGLFGKTVTATKEVEDEINDLEEETKEQEKIVDEPSTGLVV